MLLYVCHGKMSAHLLNEQFKENKAFKVVLIFSAILHIAFLARLFVYTFLKKTSSEHETSNLKIFLRQQFKKEAIFRYYFVIFSKLDTINI